MWQVPLSWDQGPTVGPGPWRSWGPVLAAGQAPCPPPGASAPAAHQDDRQRQLSSGTAPSARAAPLALTRQRQPETAARGLPAGGEGGPSLSQAWLLWVGGRQPEAQVGAYIPLLSAQRP